MKRDRIYAAPDLECTDVGTEEGFTASEQFDNDRIEAWTGSEGDDNWFSAN